MADLSERKCKWCDEGVKLVGSDHWIVKSIIPARIKVVSCLRSQQSQEDKG